MSQENVEVVRIAFAAVNRGDLDAAFFALAPDCEVDLSRAVGIAPGTHTASQARVLVEEFVGTWESARWEVLEYIDSGEHVVTPVINHLQGRDGIQVQARVTWLWTVRDGAIKRLAIYQELEEALEAVGLRE